jgi:DNA topoisomerase VI subunit A
VRMGVVVDWDPHGIGIAAVYRCGSVAQWHSPLRLRAGDRLRWLGVRGLVDKEVHRDAMIVLTDTDRRAALGLLRRPEAIDEDWRFVCQSLLTMHGGPRWDTGDRAGAQGGAAALDFDSG